ncbi:MAG: ExeA family protein [Hasllibacter sp.]
MPPPRLYCDFFGLRERPFTLVPDPDAIFWSEQHRRAYMILEYALMSRAPVTLITGEIGAGKTTLVQALLRGAGEDVTIGLVSNAQGSRGDVLSWALASLGIPAPSEDYVRKFQALEAFLISEYAAGRRVVLIFDEAQNLSAEGIEQLRLLTNVNSGKDELIQLVLVGQPELRQMVLDPSLRQLAQRITAAFHLGPMEKADVRAYLAHRMRAAGGAGTEFSIRAADAIHEATGGVPRLVNQLADFALLYAWSADRPKIGIETVRAVQKDEVFFWQASRDEAAAAADPKADPEAGGAPAEEAADERREGRPVWRHGGGMDDLERDRLRARVNRLRKGMDRS